MFQLFEPTEFDKDSHLLEDSSELCVVVVLEVEPVGEVEVEGRGQEQQERVGGVHSASNERRLARPESEVGDLASSLIRRRRRCW